MAVGIFQIGDPFARKIGWEPFLPKLMFPLDFAFGLGGGGVEQGHAVEMEGLAELREGVREVSEEEGVVIHVEGQGQAVGRKSKWAKSVSRG